MRLLMALAIAGFAFFSYISAPKDENPITGAMERVAIADENEEMALGQQAAPETARQFGGVSGNQQGRVKVQQMGQLLLTGLDKALVRMNPPRQNPYRFQFTLLADPQTVNAFALPGGQVFITEALFDRLQTDGQLAGVLGHEIGHVLERHGNKRMAKQKLFSGLATAGGVFGGDMQSAQMSQMVTNMLSMKYGRDDELESDKWGVRLCAMSGYDPRAMFGVMQILDEATGGGGGPPEMMSTHPKPANRVKYIEGVLQQEFPQGIPPGLRP